MKLHSCVSGGHHVTEFVRRNTDLSGFGVSAAALQAPWNRSAYNDLLHQARSVSADVVHIHNTLPQLSPAVFQRGSRVRRRRGSHAAQLPVGLPEGDLLPRRRAVRRLHGVDGSVACDTPQLLPRQPRREYGRDATTLAVHNFWVPHRAPTRTSPPARSSKRR